MLVPSPVASLLSPPARTTWTSPRSNSRMEAAFTSKARARSSSTPPAMKKPKLTSLRRAGNRLEENQTFGLWHGGIRGSTRRGVRWCRSHILSVLNLVSRTEEGPFLEKARKVRISHWLREVTRRSFHRKSAKKQSRLSSKGQKGSCTD